MVISQLLAPLAFLNAISPSECPGSSYPYLGTKVSVYYSERNKECTSYIMPTKPGRQWRIHSFSSEGLYMIFNNLDYGFDSKDTGARTFWFFPRRVLPLFAPIDDTLRIQTASGASVIFDALKTRVLSSPDMSIQEDPAVNEDNEGGVTINDYKGLLLDNGFRLGEVAYIEPKRTSEFRDRAGHVCRVVNKEVFEYKYSTGPDGQPQIDEVDFRFSAAKGDELELKEFLSQRCPELDLSDL